jgi:protein SCO1/2
MPIWVVALSGLAGPVRSDAAEGAPPCHQTAPGFERAAAKYTVPSATLVDQEGKEVELRTLLSTTRPVALNFIFTSCRTICPVLSASLASLHREAGTEVEFVSISIDPEFDTPQVLRSYARRFDVGPGWRLLTGKPKTVAAVAAAFGAASGDKNDHKPLTFLRPAGSEDWVRLEGFPPTKELVAGLGLKDLRANR